jgi:kynurenine formamidase
MLPVMLGGTDLMRNLAFALALLAGGCADITGPGLWPVYQSNFEGAKYIDLTHAFAPGDPAWPGFGSLRVEPARAAIDIPGLIAKGEAFTYTRQGAGITAYSFPTDQVGTQLDPPAHGNALGATISDFPPTMAVRPLVVIDLSEITRANPAYVATVEDISAWERRHGRMPPGCVVMFRTDWSKHWQEPNRFLSRPFPGISVEALKFLHLERHILFHGHEPFDTDATPDLVAERWLLTHDFAQAEGVANLDQVPEAGALIAIGFARPEGGTGGLARFIAIAPASWRYGTTIAQSPGAPLPRQASPLERGADNVLRPEKR